MKKWLKIVTVLVLFTIIGVSVYKVFEVNSNQDKFKFKEQQGERNFQNSHQATGMNLNDESVYTFEDNNEMKLKEIVKKNNLTIVNLFASWCDPCKREMPELVKYAKNKENDVELIGLNVKDKHQSAKDLLNQVDANYSIYTAQDDFLKKYKMYNIPTTLFVDKNGEIKKVYLGELTEKTLHNLVNQIKEEN